MLKPRKHRFLLLTLSSALIVTIFFGLAFATPKLRAEIDGAISAQQASNDATNVYYQFNYTSSDTYYQVLIDTNQSATNGLKKNGIGADYLLENGSLYRYIGNGTTWSWSFIKNVTHSKVNNVARWTVVRSDIGESATPNQADLVFQLVTGSSATASTAKYTHIYSSDATAPILKTVTYASTTALFPNPERGFYRYFESRASNMAVWNTSEFANTNAVSWMSAAEEATITQAYCIFYLDSFLESEISPVFLNNIRANLETARAANKKCILRFAYSDNGVDKNANDLPDILENPNLHTEPDLPRLLAHIEQLKPTLQDYADVITVLQAGFIGLWGEWYYTDHFVDNPSLPGNVSVAQYEKRKQVVNALLNALPATRMVALRYPELKKQIYGRTAPITASEALTNTPLARLGFHNDAFLNEYGDMGTFLTSADRTYLEQESIYLNMGGEVNEPTANAPARDCISAINEMKTFHWSYINTDYFIPTLQAWSNGGCIHNTTNIANSMLDRLGYRYVLKQGKYPTTARPGGKLAIQITLANEGFAAAYNPRQVLLVMQNISTGQYFTATLPDDPRRWLANGQNFAISRTVNLPTIMSSGQYSLALHLADPTPNLRVRPQYSIRMANANLWRMNSGWNDLQHTVAVSSVAAADANDLLEDEGIELVEAGFLSIDADPIAVEPIEEQTTEIRNFSYLPIVSR